MRMIWACPILSTKSQRNMLCFSVDLGRAIAWCPCYAPLMKISAHYLSLMREGGVLGVGSWKLKVESWKLEVFMSNLVEIDFNRVASPIPNQIF